MAAVLGLALAPGASAGPITLDLRYEPNVKLLPTVGESPAGDVNGDGAPDVVVSDCGGAEGFDTSYVIYGPLQADRIDLRELDEGGFRIQGASRGDEGCFPAAAGDVNGDGLDDVLIGADAVDNNGRTNSGTVYVVFGKTDTEPVELADFDAGTQGDQGFRIDGAYGSSLTGRDLAGAGDVNGDGFDDVLVGAAFAGRSYVVFGLDSPLPVDLLTFEANAQGPRGFRIDTPSPEESSGYAVAGAGDTNGDGLHDLIIGVYPKIHRSTGSAYVVFGKMDPAPVDVRQTLALRGYQIKGMDPEDATGYAVAGAGDVNGDGLEDVIVGAPQWVWGGWGYAFVVFGKEGDETVHLKELGEGGFKIRGVGHKVEDREEAGISVAGTGDMNGDGLADVVVGAPGASHNGRKGSGSVYVVYGRRSTTTLRLAHLGNRGFRIDGEHRNHSIGDVDGPGDMNDDGVPDILIGRPFLSRTAYIVWGR